MQTEFHPIGPSAALSLEGIGVDAVIGIDGREVGRAQRLAVDVVVHVSEQCVRIDDTPEALARSGYDYGAIRAAVREAASRPCALVETFATRVIDSILQDAKVDRCAVRVAKRYCWPDVEQTSIVMSRERGAECR